MASGEWFVIQSGQDADRWHLAGWYGSAFLTYGPGVKEQLVGFATCPRCFAMVISDGTPGHPDQVWAHEDWHHRTDYPHPETPFDQVTIDPGPGVRYDDPTAEVTHLTSVTRKYGIACNNPLARGPATSDPGKVTCRMCKRAGAWAAGPGVDVIESTGGEGT
jgi:hypothetical protein